MEYIRAVLLPGPVSGSSSLDYATHTPDRSPLGVKIGCQSFTDLDYVDDVALLAELLHILTHGLGVMSEEASLLGLQVNWTIKPKSSVLETMTQFLMVDVRTNQVEVIHKYTYLGACTTCDGSSESEILRLIGIARNCMTLLEKHA